MIDEQVLEKLEFEKILNQVSKYCVTENGKNLVLKIYPSSDINIIINECTLLSEAKEILNKAGYPPIDFISDLNQALSECKIEGAILSSQKVL